MARNSGPNRAEALELVKEKSWEADFPSLMRLMRFTIGPAEKVAELTGAVSRDTIYSWAAKRAFPNPEQERYLRTVASLVTLVHKECDVHPEETRNFLHSFNYDQSGIEGTRLERLSAKEVVPVFEETVQSFIERQLT